MDNDQQKQVLSHRLLRNTLRNSAGNFVSLATWFLLTPFILGELGPKRYGLWVLVGSVVAYGSLLDFGIAGAVTKYVAEYRAKGQIEQVQPLIGTALSLYSLLGLIVVALSSVLAFTFPILFNISDDQQTTAFWLTLLAGFGVGLSIPCATASAVLRGLQRFDLMNLIMVGATLLTAGATIAALMLQGGVISLVLINIIVLLLTQIPSIWLINRLVPGLQFGWHGASLQLVRRVTSFSWPLFVIHIGGQLKAKTDEIVIGAFHPVSAVTPYNIARKLSTLPQILTDQFITLLLPVASELDAERDRGRQRSLYLTSTRLTLAIFLPLGSSLVILARPILSLWVGAAYADYANLLLILVLASLVDTSLWPASSILVGMNQHRPIAVFAVCSGLTNLGLSIVLLHLFGLVGVALGTLLPVCIVGLGFGLPYAMRVIGVTAGQMVRETLVPALTPAIPMVIVMYILREALRPASVLSLLVVAGSGVLLYVIAYLRVRPFERRMCQTFALSTLRLFLVQFRRL